MDVIKAIGINANGCFQPISMEDGNKTRNEISIPFIIAFIFKSMMDNKNPITIHMENAEILASHVNFWMIIGITSIIPAIIPSSIPILIFFMIEIY